MSSRLPRPIDLYAEAERASFPSPVRGWLLYWCISLTILVPWNLAARIHSVTVPSTLIMYVALALSSFGAGITLWARSRFAFTFLRVALVVRLGYLAFQIYTAIRIAHSNSLNGASIAQTEFIYAASNGLGLLVFFLYFRVSSRVAVTYGRNI